MRVDSKMNEQKNAQKSRQERLMVSYILNAVGFFGFTGGLHRLYNGKIGTGLLWMCTFGMFGIGQLVDLFLIPNMVDEREMRLKLKAGLSPWGIADNTQAVATQVYQSPQESLMLQLLKAAAAEGGKLTVTKGVISTGASFTEVETTLQEMLKSGYVTVGNNPENGAVTYEFHELG